MLYRRLLFHLDGQQSCDTRVQNDDKFNKLGEIVSHGNTSSAAMLPGGANVLANRSVTATRPTGEV